MSDLNSILYVITKKIKCILSLLFAMAIGFVLSYCYYDFHVSQPILSDSEIDDIKINIETYGSISDYLSLVYCGDNINHEELRMMSYVMAIKYNYPDAYYHLATYFKSVKACNKDSLCYYLKEGASKGSLICCEELLSNHALQYDYMKWLINKRHELISEELNNVTTRYAQGIITKIQKENSIVCVVYKYDCNKTVVGHDWSICTNLKEGDTTQICFSANDCTISMLDVPNN